MKLRLIICLLLSLSIELVYPQVSSNVVSSNGKDRLNISNSPLASSFRVFGDFPASNYIGVADIKVPVYDIQHRGLNFPIELRYHNGIGNKVEEEDGVVGLGWSLTNGGVISLVESKKYISNGGLGGVRDNIVSGDDWSSPQTLKGLLGGDNGNGKTLELNSVESSSRGTVLAFNFNGFSGEIYFDHLNRPRLRSKDDIMLDIELTYMDATNRSYTKPGVEDNSQVSFHVPLGEILKIVLRDKEGTSYEFGGTSCTIDFSSLGQPATLLVSNTDVYRNATKTIPVAWHLKRILFVNGEEITFNYVEEKPFYITSMWTSLRRLTPKRNPSYDLYLGRNLYINEEQATLIHPVLLSSIVSPRERLAFSYETDYSQRALIPSIYDDLVIHPNNIQNYDKFQQYKKNVLFKYKGIRSSYFDLVQLMRKLKTISVYDNKNDMKKTISFKYKTGGFNKTKLLEMKSVDNRSEKENVARYVFKYDMPSSSSPSMNSYSKDDYGFYSTKEGYQGFIPNNDFGRPYLREDLYNLFKDSEIERRKYVESRKPEISIFNTWEVLNEIVYPTGGYTQFEYEPNMYGGIAHDHPFTVNRNYNGVEKPAGGIRIKRIKNYDSNDAILSSKSYKYINGFAEGGIESSGILTHVPTYFEFIHIDDFEDYFNWSTKDIYPANRLRGNHITYSEVTEIDDLDHSFKVFKYKNFDNGYHDKSPLAYASNFDSSIGSKSLTRDENGDIKEFWKKKDAISMGLERGQLLGEILYSSTKKKVKEIQYSYNNDLERFNEYIRTLNLYHNNMFDERVEDGYSSTYIASKIYTYTPYLTKKTVIDYVGNNSVINSETSYKYNDTYKLLTEKTEKRGAKTFKTTYKYPFDFTESVYTSMVNKNIVAPVILEENYINGVKVSATKVNYKSYVPRYALPMGQSSFPGGGVGTLTQYQVPKDVEVQFKNGVWEKQLEFLTYDDKMNVLSTKDITGKTTNYLWGYKKTLPIWTIENVPYSTISTALGESEINLLANADEPSVDKLNLFKQKMDANAEIKGAFKTHYLYDPILGLTYKETPLGLKEYYKYDGFGRLVKVEDGDLNTLIEYEYNYKQN